MALNADFFDDFDNKGSFSNRLLFFLMSIIYVIFSKFTLIFTVLCTDSNYAIQLIYNLLRSGAHTLYFEPMNKLCGKTTTSNAIQHK
jgi:hypothetical protein